VCAVGTQNGADRGPLKTRASSCGTYHTGAWSLSKNVRSILPTTRQTLRVDGPEFFDRSTTTVAAIGRKSKKILTCFLVVFHEITTQRTCHLVGFFWFADRPAPDGLLATESSRLLGNVSPRRRTSETDAANNNSSLVTNHCLTRAPPKKHDNDVC